jgi:hypothetical protein
MWGLRSVSASVKFGKEEALCCRSLGGASEGQEERVEDAVAGGMGVMVAAEGKKSILRG